MADAVVVAALTDVGCVRSNNEDNFGYDPERQVYVVCDGMGGMASGEVASQMAVATFLETVAASDHSLPTEVMLNHAVHAANESVHRAAMVPPHKGMGTTLVAACIHGRRAYIANVGDSRAYLIQRQQCIQITVDHSYLHELIRTGVVAVEEAPSINLAGMQSVITRAIGVAPTVDPDFFSADIVPGDAILLTSDGLTRYVEQKEIGLFVGGSDLQTAAHSLIQLAKERGGSDNVTVILLQLEGDR